MPISAATWTAPLQWTASLAATVGRMQNFIGTGPTNNGGNLQYLYDYVQYLLNGNAPTHINREGTSDYTNATTSWADIDATNLIATLTCNSGRVYCEASMSIIPTTGGSSEFDFILDSTTRAGSTNGLVRILTGSIGTLTLPIHYSWIFTGLSVGSHTFKPQFRCDTATNTVTVKNNGYPIQFLACEI